MSCPLFARNFLTGALVATGVHLCDRDALDAFLVCRKGLAAVSYQPPDESDHLDYHRLRRHPAARPIDCTGGIASFSSFYDFKFVLSMLRI